MLLQFFFDALAEESARVRKEGLESRRFLDALLVLLLQLPAQNEEGLQTA